MRKITIEISDPLFDEVCKLARRQSTTVNALVEQGLRRILAHERPPSDFKLRRASFKGEGLLPGLENALSNRLLELALEGRGG